MSLRAISLTLLAMLAFAGNSILCRLALKETEIDPASFTGIRLAAGALTLWLIVRLRSGSGVGAGNWWSALALFAYAAAFSLAYVQLSAATGALLLFGAVQTSMIGYGVARGERLRPLQCLGVSMAIIGLVVLLLPGLAAPPLGAALWMLAAGVAWAVYSLRGRGAGDPTRVTAGNFIRALPLAVVFCLLYWPSLSFDPAGVLYAVLSGALASGVGYALWYAALPLLATSAAATVQLSVPVITAIGGILLLNEALTLPLLIACASVLGGIALVVLYHRQPA
ncbi:DMT family transporter [Halopseudomonas sp.]|uniref:DMT family transporter n=1 Tax=Halopseudomonas sp. TaxID=2901191 RepID=UPI00300253EC